MNSQPKLAPSALLRRGFTLVEIMIVVAIIGILSLLAWPALLRAQQSSQNSRYASDVRTFAQAFETYALKNGTWPPNAGTGVIPAGMSGELRDAAWTTPKNSVGGRWNWDRNNMGFAAAISCTNVTASDEQMTKLDAMIDDGDLSTGNFQKAGGRFVYILEQ